ncbi:GMC family oxidoreductase N-terminal domain-containing protein [Pseudomonas sp. Ap32]|nr:GMC family oxidoreductase N-terminal domain-containing protein [Pseudomonas sp. Ap32]
MFSDKLGAVVERNGGKILLRSKVERILVEKGRAVGVEFSNKHLGKRTVKADAVICNADIKHTLLDLIGRDHLTAKTVTKAECFEMSPAMGVVYLGVDMDLKAMGLKNTNYRIYPGCDYERAYREVFAGQFPDEPHLFIGNATMKDPDNPAIAPPGIYNLQLMSAVPSNPESWGVTQAEVADGSYRNNPTYLAKKEWYARQLIALAERVIPGMSQHIVYQEVSTPFSVTRFIGSAGGTSYGLAFTPEYFLHNRPGTKTEIRNLFLCGASTRTGHGIFGAMTGGVEAAAAVDGRKLRYQIMDVGTRAEAQVSA